jgi:HK97 family phage major capsid protein
MTRNRELREKRARIVREAQDLIPASGGQLSAEIRRKFELMMDEADELKRQIDSLERPPEDQPGSGFDGNGYDEARSSREDRRFKAAFVNWLRYGLNAGERDRGLDDADRAVMLAHRVGESRDMGVGTGNLGGYFVPQGFVYDVEVAMKFISQLFANARLLDTSTGNPLPHPTANDTVNSGELVGEGQQVSTQDVAVGQIVFGAYKFSTKMVKVSLELAQDSAFPMDSFLKEQFAVRLARALNPYLTNGTGSANNQPMGIITAATASGQVVVGDDNSTNPDPTTQVGYTDLVNLEHSLDPLYRPNAKWMMHDQTLRFLKTLRDKYGRPLWVPGVATNAPDSILGYKYILNNNMDTLASGAKSLVFGDFSKFVVRRVKELSVLRLVERFADYGQIAFLGFARYDSQLLDAGTHPLLFLENA